MMKSLDTGQVLRTRNYFSYKVGCTLEEMFYAIAVIFINGVVFIEVPTPSQCSGP